MQDEFIRVQSVYMQYSEQAAHNYRILSKPRTITCDVCFVFHRHLFLVHTNIIVYYSSAIHFLYLVRFEACL